MAAKVNGTSSKADELALLKRWQKEAGEGSYLASFLTDELVTEVGRRIADDWSCDVYADAIAELGREREALAKANARVRELEGWLVAGERAGKEAAYEYERRIKALMATIEEATNKAASADYWRDLFTKRAVALAEELEATLAANRNLERALARVKDALLGEKEV